MTRRIVPIAQMVDATVGCSLDRRGQLERAEAWSRLRELHLLDARPIPGGARLIFDARATERLAEVADREAICCPGLSIDVKEGTPVVVEITGSPDARRMIRALAGFS